MIRPNNDKDELVIVMGGLDFTVHVYLADLSKYVPHSNE